jgi:hypothetical protein
MVNGVIRAQMISSYQESTFLKREDQSDLSIVSISWRVDRVIQSLI